jgi:hypothetical protein
MYRMICDTLIMMLKTGPDKNIVVLNLANANVPIIGKDR